MSEASEDMIPPAPAGFVRSEGRGAFSGHNGPYFHKAEQGELTEQAFFALPRHANGLGLVHGGMLTAFLDGLMGAAVFRSARRPGVTIHLSVDFLHMARLGDWVMGEAKVTRATREVAFVEGRVHVGGRDVVRGSGIFKLMHKRG
ncbi:MAG: PaaI family thioesterase [Caulobacteraceae bacterium]|nr:PaaI family thioesterase [Caulobacteraceae bacterium]